MYVSFYTCNLKNSQCLTLAHYVLLDHLNHRCTIYLSKYFKAIFYLEHQVLGNIQDARNLLVTKVSTTKVDIPLNKETKPQVCTSKTRIFICFKLETVILICSMNLKKINPLYFGACCVTLRLIVYLQP